MFAFCGTILVLILNDDAFHKRRLYVKFVCEAWKVIIKRMRGSFENMKQLNVSMILRLIRENAPVSRAQIAVMSGLTAATVTNITQKLLDINLILECGLRESGGGRPAVEIRLNPSAHYVFGICFAPKRVDVVLSNFEADIIESESIPVEKKDHVSVINTVMEIIDRMIKTHKVKRKLILGAGAAVNGIVDVENGRSVFAPYYQWRNIPLQSLLEDRLKCPVFIENDTNAMAISERWFGLMRDYKLKTNVDESFIALNIGNGVGAGIVINDKIYHGCNYAAGEIGHFVVDENGTLCSCGKKGCLESLVSLPAIEENVKKMLTDKMPQTQNSVLNTDIENVNIGSICEAARNGDVFAAEIIRKAGRNVGYAIASLLTSLNPSRVIIGGEIINAGDIFFNEIRATIEKETLEVLYSPLEILPSHLGRYRAARGAVALVLSDFFKAENILI